MTDKLHCPFCGVELLEWQEWGTPIGLSCPNECKTKQILDKEIWQALIDGKKAQEALDYAVAFFAGSALVAEKMGCPDIQNGYKKILKEISEIQFGGIK